MKNRKPLNRLIYREFLFLYTNLLLNSLELLGSGGLGGRLRAFFLGFFGFGNLSVGQGTSILSGFYIASVGSKLKIGKDCMLNRGCLLDCSSFIEIGNGCLIGQRVSIITGTHSIDYIPGEGRSNFPGGEIRIGDNVWIASGAIILPNVSIGNGTVVGAGSVVTKSLPDNVLAVGVPAKIIREINSNI